MLRTDNVPKLQALNTDIVERKQSEYCVVSNIAASLDIFLARLEDRDAELREDELNELRDILGYLDDGVKEYEEAKECEAEWKTRYYSLKDAARDAVSTLEYEL